MGSSAAMKKLPTVDSRKATVATKATACRLGLVVEALRPFFHGVSGQRVCVLSVRCP